MIVKTESVVLRSVDYSESSLIATLYTKSQGIVPVIAKGARLPKSRFSAALTPGQVLETIYYFKPGRAVQTLSEVSYLQKLDSLRVDLHKMAISVTTLELIGQVVHEQEENSELFDWLVTLLNWINQSEEVTKQLFPYIQLRITELIGIGIQLKNRAGSSVKEGWLNIESGTISNESGGSDAVMLTESQYTFITDSLQSRKVSLVRKMMPLEELNDLIRYLDRYILYHIDGIRPRRSDKIFETIFA